MSGPKRLILILALAALAWPEIGRYDGEILLADAAARLSAALNGEIRGDAAVSSVQAAYASAQRAAVLLPEDQRPALSQAIGLLLLHKGADASAILEAAIAQGERPELTLNLGRARGIGGDEQGAQAAFLRTAWASPAAVSTLPAALRGPLLERVKSLERELREGRLRQVPPLR
jgi:hypothetical protein